MEYLFKTVLGRNEDFEDITLRTLYSQLDQHIKFNNPKDSSGTSNGSGDVDMGQTYVDSLF